MVNTGFYYEYLVILCLFRLVPENSDVWKEINVHVPDLGVLDRLDIPGKKGGSARWGLRKTPISS